MLALRERTDSVPTILNIAACKRIVICDDSREQAETISLIVEDAGFEPVILTPDTYQISYLNQSIQSHGDAAICDHRLSPGGTTQLTGASVVALLYNDHFPAILQTQFVMDYDVSIRKYRRSIPMLLSKDELNSDLINSGIALCVEEFSGKVHSNRRAWRTLVYIDSTSSEDGEEVVDAFIPGWKPKQAVRFPSQLITNDLVTKPQSGEYYIAMVNIGAEKDEDLFFYEFQRAADPNPEDGLA